MSLVLKPFGTFRIFPTRSRQTPGPMGFRSASLLGSGIWENDLFSRAEMDFGMGSYLEGAGGDANVTVRAALRCEDGTNLFIDYVSRGHMQTHSTGESPVMLSGRIEVDPALEKYAWLNRTHVIGRGMLSFPPECKGLPVQHYEMFVVTEPGQA